MSSCQRNASTNEKKAIQVFKKLLSDLVHE